MLLKQIIQLFPPTGDNSCLLGATMGASIVNLGYCSCDIIFKTSFIGKVNSISPILPDACVADIAVINISYSPRGSMNPLRSQVGAITLTFTLILSIYRIIGIFKRDKELTITIKMLVWGKTKKKPKNDDDDDEENCGSVSVHGNHIYFYADVETKSVQALVQALLKLNKPGNMYREIFVHINSWGGYVMDAFAAIDSIRASATPVVTLIEGMCASAATMISIAGDRRLMRPNAVMLIHQLRGGMYGKKCDVDDEIINLNNLEERIIQLFKNNTKVRVKKFKAMMKRELEYPVDECLKHGFIDEVYKGESVIGKRKRE